MAMVAPWTARLGLDGWRDVFGRGVARLLAGFAAAVVLIAAVSLGAGPSGVVSRPLDGGGGLARLQSLPLQAQSVISTGVAADAPGFVAHRSAHGYWFRGGGVGARFGRRGAVVSVGAASVSFSSLALGRGGRLGRVGALSVTAQGNRVRYARAGFAEWYAAGPLGIEQGFTISHRPAGAGRSLTVALALGGSLRAQLAGSSVRFLERSGRTAMRYGGLVAVDASGRRLRATLVVRGDSLLLRVVDRGARYPVRIDPLLEVDSFVPPAFGPIALSGDGDTMLIGSSQYNSNAGGAWAFVNDDGVWTQQQAFTETGGGFGRSVALSSDGNTAAITGGMSGGLPAVWIFTRSGSTWTLQNVSTSAVVAGDGTFGVSVALSGDGNTAVIGGQGGFWGMTRAGTTWSQPGTPIVDPVTHIGADYFGSAVALSADGTTALISSPSGTLGPPQEAGGADVFTRSGNAWSLQQFIGFYGQSVALSDDGNTALVGGYDPGTGLGDVWAYTRAGGVWSSQQHITPTDEVGEGVFGFSAALSADGNTALIGGPGDFAEGAAWVYKRTGGTWSEQQKIHPKTTQGSYSNFGREVALSSDGSTALITEVSYPAQVGSVDVFASQSVKISGTVQGTACNGDTCSASALGGIPVLVTGTSSTGVAVSETDTSNATDGTWSVNVPPGTYQAGASDDGATFDLPGFSPEPTAPFAANADVPNVNFIGCTGPADASTAASSLDTASLSARAPSPAVAHAADSSTGLPDACTSVYTVTVGGRIPAPQQTIVDPGPGARFNQHDDGKPDYRRPTAFLSKFHPGLERPACFTDADIKRTYGHGPIDWYSYFKGPVDLPKYTVQFAYNQHTKDTSLVGAPEAGEAKMTKVWVWHNPFGDYGRCHLEEEVPFMYLPVPGGFGFTIIVAWGFPFEPTGVLGSLTKNEFVETVEQLQKDAPALVPEYRRAADAAQFVGWLVTKELIQHFILHLLTGGAAQAALLKKIGTQATYAPAVVAAIAKAASTLVTGRNGVVFSKELYDYYKYAASFESGEPIMSAVIHGSFDTYVSKKAPPAVVGTGLGITIRSTQVPTVSLSISRSAYKPAGQSFQPFNGMLPWKDALLGSKTSPYTANPYEFNAPTIIGDTTVPGAPQPFALNIGSGTGGLANLAAATHQLPAVNLAIHYGGLYQDFPGEESSIPTPSCATDGNLGLVLSTSAYAGDASTICWLFKDGDA